MYQNLKALRDSLNMTQEEFGKSVGLAKSTYNNYETGVREPKSDFWIAIAQKYNVSIDYLMGLENLQNENQPAPTNEGELAEDDKRIIELLHQLTPENRERVFEIIKALASQ
nr:MAG TPA: helix-turn-helix XRE-family like protein [Caudoviricetes sp.]